jgi:glyoxylase-like metal-dependent hydrolase (beta-lactamase superfamily II)
LGLGAKRKTGAVIAAAITILLCHHRCIGVKLPAQRNNTHRIFAMANLDFMTRRALLQGGAAAAVVGLSAGTAFGKARPTNRPAPGFYRFKVGEFEATVISDGPLSLGPLQSDIFKGVSKEEMERIFTSNFLPTHETALDQNALVINTGKHLVLFDTGTGKGLKAFGPNTGRLLTNLSAAGIEPKDIDVVALTHAHADHCFGLMTDRGRRIFPKAQIYMAQADYDFWTDEAKATNDGMKLLIGGARKNLIPNRNRIVFVKDGQDIVPGVQAIAAPGHTVGHTIYMIKSGNQSLCNTGDIAHHHVISTERPQVEFAYDTDGKQAVASRLRVFNMLAADRVALVSYHFPWPGLGYIARQGGAYRYFPASLRTVL